MQIQFFNKRNRKWLMAAALICLFCLSLNVSAKTLVDTDEECSITISYQHADTEFSLYKVADVTVTYRFPVTEQFEGYKVDFDALDSDEWKDMAETLAGYVKRDEVEPLATGLTDQNGTFTFENLSVGVYLVIGEQVQDGDYIYRCKSFLAFVPLETETGEWDYEPEFLPKPSGDPIELLDRTVMKIWKDDGLKENRPAEIQIQLLKDGEVFDEVSLNADNNWMHTWEDLSSEFTWQVVEKEVPGDYTVSISEEGTVFEVVNALEGEPEKPEGLPQTGQLWWPVPILAVAGLLFFMIGWVRRRTNNEN